MAYIPKIIALEEKLIGIARCHWIYVVKGLVWFSILAAIGWAIEGAVMLLAFTIADFADNMSAPLVFMSIADGAQSICLGAGFLVFLFLVIKVLVTEVGLSTRRIILKEGLLFVKVKQVDLEEIRGENMDLGHLGRLLGYGYLNLDCRFVGDVKLPAIENPEGFLNALHMARSKTQDALAIVVGKGDKQIIKQENIAQPLEVDMTVNPQNPTQQQQPIQPTPEIQPGQQPSQPEVQPQPTTPTFPEAPEIPAMPTPHNPPPQTAPQTAPAQPEITPQPQQPVPAPFNPEPPLQPPADQAVQKQPVQQQALAPQQPVVATVDPAAVAKAIEQTMPHMVEEVVKQMTEKGLIPNKEPANDDDDIDTDLISSFDEASEEGSKHAVRNKVEQSIH